STPPRSLFLRDPTTPQPYTLSLHDALPIYVQRLVQRTGWLVPPGPIEGQDRAHGCVRHSGDVRIPRGQAGPRDDVRQVGGLLGAGERRDGDRVKEVQPGQQVVCFVAARVE